jgi:hypothetical protein
MAAVEAHAAAPTVIAANNGSNPVFVEDFSAMTNAELVREWERDITERTDRIARDSLLEVLMKRGVRPDTWIRQRNDAAGIYPDVHDPDFAARIARKTEFAFLASDAVGEDTCGSMAASTTFERTPVQRLIARFLHPQTPYRGLLLNHGVGVGKTCTAITVAETYLDVLPYRRVYILAPQAIADGFRKTIFDVNKLQPASKDVQAQTGSLWVSPQCTGMTYLDLTHSTSNPSREEIAKAADSLIKTRYKILGYLAFANWVEAKFKAIPPTLTDAARADRKKEILMGLFSDSLLIIDEAHNLRDAAETGDDDETDVGKSGDAAEGKKLTPILRDIVKIAEGMRLLLMTATPMYNTAPEIIQLLNLLTLNDTKDETQLMRVRDVFGADGAFVEGGEARLTHAIRRYVSFMRGENPNTFPLRLQPPQRAGAAFFADYPTQSISRREGAVRLSETDTRILSELPLVVHTLGRDTPAGDLLTKTLARHANPEGAAAAAGAENDSDHVDISSFILDQAMQIGNVTYPDGSYGSPGWGVHFKTEVAQIGGARVKQVSWNQERSDARIEDVFGAAGLQGYAPKIAAIVASIQSAKGMSFVYSRYVRAGALPLAVALELAGWCRVLADGTPAPLLKRTTAAPKPKHFYVLLTSDEELSPNFKGLLEYATTFPSAKDAETGARVKAVIGSHVASEGLDLKCIRELHLLDGWYHLNRIEQIEGRGVRFCSHALLPPAERNCLIYLHAVHIPDYESVDLYAYRIAVRKAQPIGRVTRLMKIHAWDCNLNRNAILLKDMPTRTVVDAQGRTLSGYDVQDRPYTALCDFSETCEYACGRTAAAAGIVATANMSTYTAKDYEMLLLEKKDILRELFRHEVAIPLHDLRRTVYEDIPWTVAAVGLRDLLGRMRIQRDDGIEGTLILQNGYIVFQPNGVTATRIPLALRYGRAYGRLPRSLVPDREGVLKTDVEVQPQPLAPEEEEPRGAAAAVPVAAVPIPGAAGAAVAATTPLQDLDTWYALTQTMMREPTAVIHYPPLFEKAKETVQGWRWMFQHFASLPETPAIACRWYMDNVWTVEDRRMYFEKWLKTGLDALTGTEALYAKTYEPRELFAGRLRGYLLYDAAAGAVQTYCMSAGEDSAKVCASSLLKEVEAIVGKPVDRKAQTGPLFGFLSLKKGTVVFKTVDKEHGTMNGTECANSSNLDPHRARLTAIQAALRAGLPAEHPMRALLLEDNVDPDKKQQTPKDVVLERQAAVAARFSGKAAEGDLLHIHDLTLKQICPYTEFLFRWMDMQALDGKRWFLSVTESARAGVKMTAGA